MGRFVGCHARFGKWSTYEQNCQTDTKQLESFHIRKQAVQNQDGAMYHDLYRIFTLTSTLKGFAAKWIKLLVHITQSGESQEPYSSLESHLIWNLHSRKFASVCAVKFRHGSKLSSNYACVRGSWFILLYWWRCTTLSHSLLPSLKENFSFPCTNTCLNKSKCNCK